MSNIFDSLRKAGGKAAKVALPLIDQAQAASPSVGPEAPSEPLQQAAETAASPGVSVPTIRSVRIRVLSNTPVLPFDGVHASAAEQYRIIRTKIARHPLAPRMIGVSSPTAGDGKSISSLNIAGALALNRDVNTLLVDCDFRRSNYAALLGVPNSPGFLDVLSQDCQLQDAIFRIEQFPKLSVLLAGKRRPNPTELLDSALCHSLFHTLRETFQYVIVDGPPIGSVADYDLIQEMCDGMVVIVRPDHTNRSLGLKALTSVPPEKLLGVVINHVEPWFLFNTHDYYYYSKYYASEPKSDGAK